MINVNINKLSISFTLNNIEIVCFPIMFIYIVLLYHLSKNYKYYIIRNIDIRQSKLKSYIPLINRAIATTHASIQSIICIIYWYYYDSIFDYPHNQIYQIQYIAFDIMNGYLIYDLFMDTIWNIFNNDPTSIQMFAHHITGLVSMYCIRSYESVPGFHYIMIVMLAEISTPFLHTSWILYNFNMTKVWYYNLIGYTLILTFFIFRILLSPYLLYKLIIERHIWKNTTPYIFEINLLITFVFILLNYSWFTKLINMALNKEKSN